MFVSFILVRDTSPLSGRDAIALLTRTETLDKLRAQGYQATNFTAAVPFDEAAPLSGVYIYTHAC